MDSALSGCAVERLDGIRIKNHIKSNIMNILLIINDAPYGTEKAYNALRLANQILKNRGKYSNHQYGE